MSQSASDRIAALEARLAAVEGRLAAVEGRSSVVHTFSTPGPGAAFPNLCKYCGLPFDQCRGHTICEAAG